MCEMSECHRRGRWRERRSKALPAPRKGCGSGDRRAVGVQRSQGGRVIRPGATRGKGLSFAPRPHRWRRERPGPHRSHSWSRGKSRTRRWRCAGRRLARLVRGMEMTSPHHLVLGNGMDSRRRRCRLLRPPSGTCKACRGSRDNRLEKDFASVCTARPCALYRDGVVQCAATVAAASSSAEVGGVAQCMLARRGAFRQSERMPQGCHSRMFGGSTEGGPIP